MKYFVDPDITQASTLPSDYYQDQEMFELSKSNIFSRYWLYVADIDDVKTPGKINPVMVLPNFLDEPILLSRTLKDQLYCLSNVCTHRANLVTEQPGNERILRCRYHGRKFNLDGSFESMPEFDGVKDFPKPQDDLQNYSIELFMGKLIFTSIDPLVEFNEIITSITDRVGFLPLHEFRYDNSRSRDYLVNAHWALYVDNYLEGFHIPYVHSSLNEVLDYGEYQTELFDHGNLQIGIAEGGELSFDLPEDHYDNGKEIAAYYFWVFPNLMLNFYPWGLSLNIVKPISIDRTKISFRTYVWKPELLGYGAGTGLDRVEREDEEVVESVSKGLKSSSYKAGRFSPSREQGVHQFHRLLAKYS